MCNPAFLLVASTALTVGSGIYQAQAARQAGNYNAKVAEQNAKVADAQARDAVMRGEQSANEQRMKTRLMIGHQRAALAANNVDLQMGTPLDILGDTALFGAIDEQRIRANARREAWGFEVQGTNYRNQASMDRFSGRTTANATLLGTAATAFGNFAGSGLFAPKAAAAVPSRGIIGPR